MTAPSDSCVPFNLPSSLGDGFKGRNDFLSSLRLHLLGIHEAGASSLPRRPCVLHGLGGLGKTRTSLEYGHRFKHDFSAILLIRADTPDNFNRNLADLCVPTLLDLPEATTSDQQVRRQAVIRWLAQHSRWLLIIDNVDSDEMALLVEELLPQLHRGQVLITSRTRDWGDDVRVIPLDVLSDAAAIEILTERTAGFRPTTSEDDTDLRTLATRLEGLPLAVEQAAAYIRIKGISFARYLALWDSERHTLLEWFIPQRAGKGYPMSVAVTWAATFNQLSGLARAVLEQLSFMAPAPIPCALLENQGTAVLLHSLAGDANPTKNASVSRIDDARVELVKYSLIRYLDAPPSTFSVHRLVQDIVRLSVKKELDGDEEGWDVTPYLIALCAPENGSEIDTWAMWAGLAPHLEKLFLKADWKLEPKQLASLLNGYGLYLQCCRGLYSAAEPLLRRALELHEKTLGPKHKETLISVNNLAILLKDIGKLKEAEPLYRRAVRMSQKLWGRRHSSTLICILNLAAFLEAKGDSARSELLHRRVLKEWERLLGPEHPSTLICINNLAKILQDKGEIGQAELLLRRNLEVSEMVLGAEHPETLRSVNNLAGILFDKGDLDQAEPLHRRALEMRERVLGKDHPETLNAINHWGHLLRSKGEIEQALLQYKRALESYDSLLGPEHPRTLQTLCYIADILRDNDEYEPAELLYREVLEVRMRVLSEDHPDTLETISNLGQVLQNMGDLAQAEEYYRRALEARERVLGPEHRSTLISVNNLACLFEEMGDMAQAEQLLRRTLERSERLLGKQHSDTQKVAANLKSVLQSMQEAIPSTHTSPMPSSASQHPVNSEFDVFLCHNSKDKPEVRKLKTSLQAMSLRTWFDEDQLVPGRPWQDALEAQINTIGAAIVCIGEAGEGPWQHMEQSALIRQFVDREIPVIPVYLRTCVGRPKLPIFLSGFHFVDMRVPIPDPLEQLMRGITHRNLATASANIAQAQQQNCSPRVSDSGDWIMINDQFYETSSVEFVADKVTLDIPADGALLDADIQDLKSNKFQFSNLDFAHGNSAYSCHVEKCDQRRIGGKSTWSVTLALRDYKIDAMASDTTFRINGKMFSPSEVAKLRAGRLLLNNPPVISKNHRHSQDEGAIPEMLLSQVNYCVLNEYFSKVNGNSLDKLKCLRLASVVALKKLSIFTRIIKLELMYLEYNKIQIACTGRRPTSSGSSDSTEVVCDGIYTHTSKQSSNSPDIISP